MTDQPWSEPRASRWRRRSKTIPIMLGATAVAIGLWPVWVAAATLRDLRYARWRLPTVRVFAFVVQYLINDSVEILLAGPMWVAAGFGTRLGAPASQRRHQQLQAWSIGVLARRAESLLDLRLQLESGSEEQLSPGPAIVLCRHVSLFDASLPALLYQRMGIHTRGVIMAELLADPGFDLLYQRSGSVFIPREDDPTARQQVAGACRNLDGRNVAVIFPEGRLFRPDALERAFVRLAQRDSLRAERLSGLRHVLPPRPGGVLAMLDAAPTADVVVIRHVGLDDLPSVRTLPESIPFRDPVLVSVVRVPRADVPEDAAARIEWLDSLWSDLDQWVHAHRAQ